MAMILRNLCFLITLLVAGGFSPAWAEVAKPLRALLITGGCCHNYPFQCQQLTNAVAKLAAVEWTVVMEGGNGNTRLCRSVKERHPVGVSH